MPGNELGNFSIGLDIDLSGLDAGMKQATNKMKSATDKMVNQTTSAVQTMEARFKKMGETMKSTGDKMKSVGTGLTAVTGALALIGGSAIKAGMDSIEAEQMFDVSLGDMAKQARDFSIQMKASLGVSEYETRKYIAVVFDMSRAMGLAKEDAYDMSTGITKLTYDLSSFKNLSVDEAFQKITAALTGESEPMKRLGYIVNETTVKNWALTNGIIQQGQELTETQKTMVRYNLMLDQTKTAQGDLARTLDSPANKMRILQAGIHDTMIELGMGLMPAFNALLNIAKPIVKALGDLVHWFNQLSPATQTVVGILGGLVAIGGPVIYLMGGLVSAIGTLMPVMGALAALVTGTLIPAVTGIATGLLALIGPFEIAVAAIIGLWAAWKANFGNIQNHWNSFKTKFIDSVKNWINSIKTMFGGLGKIFQGVWSMLSGNFKKGWGQIKAGGVDVAKGYAGQWTAQFDVIKSGAVESANFIGDAFKQTTGSVSKLFQGAKTKTTSTAGGGKSITPGAVGGYTGISVATGGVGGTTAKESAFEKAQKQYEMEIIQLDITNAQKLALYKKYLADVKKTDDEKYEYEKQLKEFSVDIAKEEAEEKKRLQKATFEDAKDKYGMDILQAGITTDEKLRLYKKYLDGVKKTVEQEKEYQRQLKEFAVQQKEKEIAEKKAEDEAYKNYVSGYTNQIANLFRQGLDAMLDGTLTFQNALQAVWMTVRDMFLTVITQMFQDWLKAEIAKRAQAMLTTLVMQTQGKSALLALGGVLGAAASALISAVGSVGMTVLSMMGSIGAAIAAIPGAGWVMGGLIIAGVAAAIGKISGLMSKANETTTTAIPAFAEGAMEIGQSGLAMVHSGETILPAKSAEKFRESGGGMGGTEISVSMPIQTIDSKDFKAHIADSMKVVTDELRKQMRYGKF
jgi:hypothetical protein